MAEYRIDDLARAAGTTVRNIRLYQEQGLLPPPERRGRVGIYSDPHLARLCLIGHLLQRGHTFAKITELIATWQQGRELTELLDLEAELIGPWSDELPEYLTMADVLKMFGSQLTPELIERAIALGIGEPVGTRFRIPSPRLLHVGAELVAIGMPPEVVLDLLEEVRGDVERLADRLVRALVAHVLTDREPGWLPSAKEIPQLAALTQRMRPLPQDALAPLLARAMENRMRSAIAEVLSPALDTSATTIPQSGTSPT